MNIVILVGNYLPKCSAVGNCMCNVADCLKESHDVTVLAFRQSDAQSAMERIDGQTVVRVETFLGNLRNRADAAIRTGGITALLWRGTRLLTQVARRVRLRFGRDGLDEQLVTSYLEALDNLEEKPDLLVPACMPYEAVEAAVRYREGHPNIFLVPYLFDQFAASATLYSSSALCKTKEMANLALERRMLELSDAVLNITWEDHVRSEFPEMLSKLKHVEHPLLVRPRGRTEVLTEMMGSRMVYAGALSTGIRDPSYTLGLIAAVVGRSRSYGETSFYVPNALSARHWFDEYAASRAIELLDAVPSDQLPDIYANASWLLSIGNSKADQKVSKVYEYMATGKPIVHVACRRDDATAEELAMYPLALCVFQDNSIEENVSRLCSFLDATKGKVVAFEDVARLFSEELPEVVADLLLESVRESALRRCPCSKREPDLHGETA